MDELAAAWRRHRIRRGEIQTSADELYEAIGSIPARHFERIGYYEILVAASDVVLMEGLAGRDPLPILLVASGAVS